MISILLYAGNLLAQSDTFLVDKIVGIVGDKVVLLSDVELQFQQMKLEQDIPDDFKCELLNQMLSNKMYLEQALLDSLAVSEDEIESELDRRIRYFVGMIGSEQKLEAYYEKSIIEIKNEFREDIREQLLSQKMQGDIIGKTKVTPAEVKTFFNAIPKDSLPYFNAEVEVGQIVVFPEISEVQRNLALDKINGLLERLNNGEDFCTLALIYSEDPSNADQCGDLGIVGRGEFVTEFEAAAFRLDDGEVSEVVETKYGFHLIQMVERKGNRIHVRHILVKPKVTTSDLDGAKNTLDSIRRLIVSDSVAFNTAVARYSEDEETKHQGGMLVNPQTGNTYFEINQLDKTVYFAIEGLQLGEISQPLLYETYTGEKAYRIVFLKTETEPHVANLQDDYYRIKAAALSQKEDEVLRTWLTEKIKDSYIWIDKGYNTCPSMSKWYIENKESASTYE